MSDTFINKIIDNIRSLHLLTISSFLSIVISSLVSIPLTTILQQLVIGYVGNRNIVPVLDFEELALLVWFALFLLLRKILTAIYGWILAFSSQDQREKIIDFTKLKLADFNGQWITQGSPVLGGDGLVLTNTNSGCLLRPNYIFDQNVVKICNGENVWRDFDVNIKVNFKKIRSRENEGVIEDKGNYRIQKWITVKREYRKVLGVVFRAQSLDDYFLIEIWKIGNKVAFRPHVRVGGNWDAPIYNPPAVLVNKDRFNIIIKVDNNMATVFIDGKEAFEWLLPKNYEVNLSQHSNSKDDLKGAVVKMFLSRISLECLGLEIMEMRWQLLKN